MANDTERAILKAVIDVLEAMSSSLQAKLSAPRRAATPKAATARAASPKAAAKKSAAVGRKKLAARKKTVARKKIAAVKKAPVGKVVGKKAKKAAPVRRIRRTSPLLKENPVITLLQKAGKKGLSVSHMASTLGISTQKVRDKIGQARKNGEKIRNVGKGKGIFALPDANRNAHLRKVNPVLELLKKTGDKGLTMNELSSKLGISIQKIRDKINLARQHRESIYSLRRGVFVYDASRGPWRVRKRKRA